jgi:protein gp37
MSSKNTGISWTDGTWNPVAGCSLVSPGCTRCYAMKTAWRMQHSPNAAVQGKYAGTASKAKDGVPVWTGKVRLWEPALLEPLDWSKPMRVFVNSMSDLFHDGLSAQDIARVWAIMALTPQHEYQVLTKRTKRMRDWLNDPATSDLVATEIKRIKPTGQLATWPLENVWVGTSVEDQVRANERIPLLLACNSAVRFISAEPLLGAVDLAAAIQPVLANATGSDTTQDLLAGLHWVIVGGESGRKARPMHVDWARALRDECGDLGIPFFFKQVGEWTWNNPGYEAEEVGVTADGRSVTAGSHGSLRMYKVGKEAAGDLLDGVGHDAFPAGRQRLKPAGPSKPGLAKRRPQARRDVHPGSLPSLPQHDLFAASATAHEDGGGD